MGLYGVVSHNICMIRLALIVLNWQYTQLAPCCTESHETVTNTCSLASICVAKKLMCKLVLFEHSCQITPL